MPEMLRLDAEAHTLSLAPEMCTPAQFGLFCSCGEVLQLEGNKPPQWDYQSQISTPFSNVGRERKVLLIFLCILPSGSLSVKC